ncbi:UNVERIFIED_CONTAM: hypothetical protein GTU68_057263 [Idotea baltica]|nr:hypothetical protein [Idotea baltica]
MQNPARSIIEWYQVNGRDLPWRSTQDPYQIWLSEIILQQTRVDQGMAYWKKFVKFFPTVHDLAKADHDTVMKMWEGLGYYSRARNLHHTAKAISEEMGGAFPNHWSELIKLKGIGDYTSRAIGSISFGNQVAVIDGNVFRVATRFLADFSPIDVPSTRKNLQARLDQWIKNEDAASFNQGIMDLGSMVCTPKKPSCSLCPLQKGCKAFQDGCMEELPVKAKKLKRKTQFLEFFLVGLDQDQVLVRRRPMQGIWAGLWEIPSQEVDETAWNRAQKQDFELLGAFKHVLTHIDMMIKVYRGNSFPGEDQEGLERIGRDAVETYGFSRAVLKIFERYLG